jgi:polysaccharide export outer membrane protein
MKKFLITLFLIFPLFAEEVYHIEPGDVLEILILGEEELSRTVMVMHNGNISFPLIGEVKIAGLTTEEAGKLIAQKLKNYFTHPVVSVILKSPTLPHVSVFGEVLRPGAVEYQRGLKITDYIALAGGPTPDANLKGVMVVRFAEGKPVSLKINVDEILKKGLTDKNFELKSGDWVYIPKKFRINWGIILNTLALAVSVLNLYITLERVK